MKFGKFCIVPIRKLIRKENTHVLSLLVFYENREIIIFKELGSAVYCITKKYLCVDYTCLQRAKLSLEKKVFESTTFNYI